MALFAACRRSDTSAAGTPPGSPHETDGASSGDEAAADATFLALSRALTGKHDLDPYVAGRIRAAMAIHEPATTATLDALQRLAGTVDTPDQFIAIPAVRDAALSIVAAWYTGTVGKGTEAVTVAYRDALMQRPVADGIFPATYAKGGPAWWVAAPPPAVAAR